mmetsp:Transcript_13530/g.16116  ORF Transcript_13530/g.16116 Transcript_13530/m.16116 type:complete len:490 (+) Transcript_13530:30-1499(+)
MASSLMTENGFAVAAAGAIIVVSMVSCCGNKEVKAEPEPSFPVQTNEKSKVEKKELNQKAKVKSEKSVDTSSTKKGKAKSSNKPKEVNQNSEESKKKRIRKKNSGGAGGAKTAKEISEPVVEETVVSEEDQNVVDDDEDELNKAQAQSSKKRSAGPKKQPIIEDGWTAVDTSKKDRKSKMKSEEVSVTPLPTSEEVPAPVAPVAEVDVGPTKPSTTVSVDPKKIGAVIGPKGTTMKRIEEVTGCRLRTLEQEPDVHAKSAHIHVEGPDVDSVRDACRLVTELCSKGYSAKLQGGDFVEEIIEINSRNIPDLVGSGGVVIKALRDGCGVIANLPPQKKLSSGVDKMVKVTVAGPKSGVMAAQAAIHDLMTKYYSSVTHPGFTHAEFAVEDWQIARFCGKAGSNIRHIQGDSKARVYVPRGESATKKVLVVGTTQQVGIAKKHVVRILENIKEQANRVSSEESFASAHRANKADDDDEPHEDWMDEYLYKR